MTFEESDKLDISAADGTRIPRNESNLVYRSAKGLFDKVGQKITPPEDPADQPHPHGPGAWVPPRPACGPAGREPDAGRCAQHPAELLTLAQP